MTRKTFTFLSLAALATIVAFALTSSGPAKSKKDICCEKKCEKTPVQPADNMMIDNISRQFIVLPVRF